MAKYIPDADISAAEHDKVYSSCDASDLISAGITEDDAFKLSRLGWMNEDNYIASYV